MRILFVTPFSHTSAIGRSASLIVDELISRGIDVVVATCDWPRAAPSELLASAARVLTTTAEFNAAATGVDHILYNIGNHAPYHARLPDMVRRHPGILIFHDWYLYDLFYGTLEIDGQMAAHDTIIRRLYGPDAPLAGLEHLSPQDMMLHRARNFPMTEWLAPYGIGAIAHSTYCLEALRRGCGGPVRCIPLAFQGPEVAAPRSGEGGLVRIATFGHLNANKRAESVIRAIASSPELMRRCRYRIVGSASEQDRARLLDLAVSLGYDGLTLTGALPQDSFDAELAAADIVCCLRYPTLESASATAIEAMQSARPAIVTNAGFYADLPDDLVFKVEPSNEVRDLAAHLTALVADERGRIETGARAREWARARFSARTYVDELLAMLPAVAAHGPLHALGDALSADMIAMNLPADDALVDRLSQTSRDLFQLRGETPTRL